LATLWIGSIRVGLAPPGPAARCSPTVRSPLSEGKSDDDRRLPVGSHDLLIGDVFSNAARAVPDRVVEILTMCPTGWFIETEEAPDYLEDNLASVHVTGVLKDAPASAARPPGPPSTTVGTGE
jgi:hypothetical protein